MDKLHDYIIVLKNIVSHDLCDQILKEYKNMSWDKATINGDKQNYRTCTKISMSFPGDLEENQNKLDIDNKLFECAAKCITEYITKFPHAIIMEDTGYELLRYKTGQYYKEHTDTFLVSPRLVSCSFHLNDDYEGGEFAFFNRKLKYKLDKGDVLMFPSTFMYPHEVMPVTKGTRYSIITWFR